MHANTLFRPLSDRILSAHETISYSEIESTFSPLRNRQAKKGADLQTDTARTPLALSLLNFFKTAFIIPVDEQYSCFLLTRCGVKYPEMHLITNTLEGVKYL